MLNKSSSYSKMGRGGGVGVSGWWGVFTPHYTPQQERERGDSLPIIKTLGEEALKRQRHKETEMDPLISVYKAVHAYKAPTCI